jgi:hypothetical protein
VSEQIIDLKSVSAILRRHLGALIVALILGALAGGALGYRIPPSYLSTSIVLLPPIPQASSTVGTHSIDTQVQIANSEAVLGPAGRSVSPQLRPSQVAGRVQIIAPTTDVLSITATGPTAAAAEALSDAVAKAEVDYLKAAASSLGQAARKALAARESTLKDSLAAMNAEIAKTQGRLAHENASSPAGKADAAALGELTAQQGKTVLQIDQIEKEADAAQPLDGQPGGGASVIQQASPGISRPVALQTALFGGAGAGAAFLLTGLLFVLRGRRESTLRSRDQIADAVGIPVVASIQSRAPRSVAGWSSLLESYAPDSVELWALRQLLRLVTPGTPVSLAGELEDPPQPAKVVVLTLAGDLPALAAGPQFASLAASTGTVTQLVTAQHHESANALWAACASLPPEAQLRPGLWVDTRPDVRPTAQLVVHLAVTNRAHPELAVPGVGRAVTLLAVTSGAATPEDLARVALAADEAGHAIDRIVIVDADPLDRTTGRLLPTERAQHLPLPSLMTGSTRAGEATALEARRRVR